MKKIFCLACFLVCMSIQMLAQGIAFQKKSFENALSAAKAQNKLVFVDFYTDWCGPCKSLAKNVFPKQEVGDFFNKHFISLKLNAEKEGQAYARKYKVSAYPTLLFLNGDGEVMLKHVGGSNEEGLLQKAAEAVNSENNPNNLANLLKRYETEKKNEKFLLTYIQVLHENDESVSEAIEEFLKIQKGIPEPSSKMMEFLLKYRNETLVGGEAERIIIENEKEYMDIATKSEARDVADLHFRMFKNSRERAVKTNNAELFKKFLDAWKQYPTKHRSFENETAYELDLLRMQNNLKEFRTQTIAFLDDMIVRQPVAEVQQKDRIHYEDFCKKNPAVGGLADIIRNSNKDLIAGINERFILKYATYMLSLAKKSDFKHYEKWMDYAKQLVPTDPLIDNLRSNMLYKKGDKKAAIALKEKLIEQEGPQGRHVNHFKKELKKMQDGTLFRKK